ncbi:MAG: hypothetical protein ABF537_13140, partial [Acetobacter sp.]
TGTFEHCMAGWQNTSASTYRILGGWHSYLKRKARSLGSCGVFLPAKRGFTGFMDAGRAGAGA